MVKSVENGTSLPPFLVKCYEMVSDESTNELISWSDSNDSFIIWDESKFSSQLLPKYFKHSNFSSFVRQLNIYGFRKIDTDHWQFANEAFIKGQKHLLKNIIRRKNNQNPVQKKSSQPIIDEEPPLHPEEDKRLALWKEVESLKTDRNALTQELTNVRQHQETTVSKLLLLGEQLKGMEKNQQQMLSFILMAMQSPEFLAQFFQPKEKSWRVSETGKSKLSEVIDDCEPTPSEGAIVRYQPSKDVHTKYASISEASTYEEMDFDFSSDEMRDLLMDVELLLGPGPADDPFENHGQFVVPDVPENDAVLEQLLLPYSSTENDATNSKVNFGLAFHPQEPEKSDGSVNDVDEDQNQMIEATEFQSSIDTSQKVEVLTEKSNGSADDVNEDQNQMTEATEFQSSIDTSLEVFTEKSNGSADDADEDQNQMTEATEFQSTVDASQKVEVLTKQLGSLTSETS